MNEIEINSKIYKIRGKQVMLDKDLADLYQVSTTRLNEQVKRNKDRFPNDFCFRLNDEEFSQLRKNLLHEDWISQNATSNSINMGLRRRPFAFTEQGVAMLSAVLKSKTAIEMSVKIIQAFVEMRHLIHENLEVYNRLNQIEKKQLTFEIKTEQNFEKVFNALQTSTPKKGIFYNGQIFDAYSFVSSLIKQAKNQITLIDNYIDETTLTLLSKKQKQVKVKILTNNITEQLKLDIKKFNEQYKNLEIKKFKKSHDRFLIIDNDVYHFGASLKDLGKKIFGFSKFSHDIDFNKIIDIS